MTQVRVAVSGATSFTGTWLCHAFNEAGYEVHGLCGRAVTTYGGLVKTRSDKVKNVAVLHEQVRAEDSSMQKWIRQFQPRIWIHHHHHMRDFRSPNYDYEKALQVGLEPLAEILSALKESGCRGIIFSGSYFEPGEGGNPETGHETLYSKSKKAVWTALAEQALALKLPLSKVVIPDPIGPMENEDRLIPLLIKYAEKKGDFQLRSPEALADHIPIEALCRIYVELAHGLFHEKTQVCRPSGWVGKNTDWIKVVSHELIESELGLTAIDLKKITLPESIKGTNYTNPLEESVDLQWNAFWKNYAQWIVTGQPWRKAQS